MSLIQKKLGKNECERLGCKNETSGVGRDCDYDDDTGRGDDGAEEACGVDGSEPSRDRRTCLVCGWKIDLRKSPDPWDPCPNCYGDGD